MVVPFSRSGSGPRETGDTLLPGDRAETRDWNLGVCLPSGHGSSRPGLEEADVSLSEHGPGPEVGEEMGSFLPRACVHACACVPGLKAAQWPKASAASGGREDAPGEHTALGSPPGDTLGQAVLSKGDSATPPFTT